MYDLTVVGAGPAGSTVARLAAKKGFKVLIIDKSTFPRPKLCAGAVSLRGDKYLPPDWDNAVVATIYGGNLGWKGERYINARDSKPMVKIVDRKSFDLYLLLKAEDEGAVFQPREKLVSFSDKGDFVEIETTKGHYKTRFLVGADGALSSTLKGLGIKRKPTPVLETFVETEAGDEVFIDIGLVKWGYGWIFPKGPSLVSVGIASLKKEKKPIRQILLEYIENHPKLRGKKIHPIKGWFIPISRGKLDLGKGRVLLVGDASGATDAVLGEGIYYSVWQAHLLADCLEKENPLQCYKKAVVPMEREFRYAYLTGWIAYNFQRFMFNNASPKDLITFFRFLRGELSYKDIFLYGVKRFMSALGESIFPFLKKRRDKEETA